MTTGHELAYASANPLLVEGDILREGELLVVRNHGVLPSVCVICGEAGELPVILLKFSWDPSFRVTKEATLKMRQKGEVGVMLCAEHRSRHRRNKLLGLGGSIGGVLAMLVCLAVAVVSENSDVPRLVPVALIGMFAGFALFVVFGFVYTLGTRTVKCVKIEGEYVWLKGVHGRVLGKVPEIRRVGGGT